MKSLRIFAGLTLLMTVLSVSEVNAQVRDYRDYEMVPRYRIEYRPKYRFNQYVRIGLTTGILIPFEGGRGNNVGPSAGLRAEWGFLRHFSGTLDAQYNGADGNTFSPFQTAVALNWKPFRSRQWQPYLGAGWGIGLGRTLDNQPLYRNSFPQGFPGNRFNSYTFRERADNFQNFAVFRMGVNVALARNVVVTGEGGYQLPVAERGNREGGMNARLGIAYQIGGYKNRALR
ncbi:hypothetical protein SAMN04515674_106131 [Pseudarcicella hirudinis]|uniref:Outer membrane protein beta-barrel domain-containing protein n=1 Tax=Pseudarcicella hirudinis TaxID=1079859 RepID=A0A1I5TP91_9BACT|nr:hypothetical protein [Pseudarcicella hirudinis]SFP84711.1 hypothetical protein SAMN04515674_106131 [Pseudarcicella hirudinis]